MIKRSDLPPVDSIIVPARLVIPQAEIDRVNDLLIGIRHKARQILKDAMEIGDWFASVRSKLDRPGEWGQWLRTNFPKVHFSTIWRYQRLAANREFLSAFIKQQDVVSVSEAIKLISQQRKMDKPRVRAVVVGEDAPPEVMLEAKLKNYVIALWQLRYLQTEIEGLLEAMKLKPDQVLRVLRYVCKEHHEVEEEVVRTFKPGFKVVGRPA